MALIEGLLGIAGLITQIDAARRAASAQSRAMQEAIWQARQMELMQQRAAAAIQSALLAQQTAVPTGLGRLAYDQIASETAKLAALAARLYPRVPGIAQNITLAGLAKAQQAERQANIEELARRQQLLASLAQQQMQAAQVMTGGAANAANVWAQLANMTAQMYNPAAYAATIPQFASLIEQNLPALQGLFKGLGRGRKTGTQRGQTATGTGELISPLLAAFPRPTLQQRIGQYFPTFRL